MKNISLINANAKETLFQKVFKVVTKIITKTSIKK